MNSLVDDLLSDLVLEPASDSESGSAEGGKAPLPKDAPINRKTSSQVLAKPSVDNSGFIKEAVSLFTAKPQKAIDYLIDSGVIEGTLLKSLTFFGRGIDLGFFFFFLPKTIVRW